MRILFRTKHLGECAGEERQAVREWGAQVGKRYIARLMLISAQPNIAALHTLQQLRFHALTGDLKGKYSITLTGRWRVIVTVQDETTLIVEEVSNHYDD